MTDVDGHEPDKTPADDARRRRHDTGGSAERGRGARPDHPRRPRRRGAVLRRSLLLLVMVGIVAALTQVQEVGQVIDRIRGDRDSDGDGLPDRAEEAGWRTESGDVYRTDPDNRDSDDDGLTDGDEAGHITDGSAENEYAGYSDPRQSDTDDDGLEDADEADLDLDPLIQDSDGDGLDDGLEFEVVGSAPDMADTDGDGFDDGFEDANRDDQGLDPLRPDKKVSKTSYATDFAKGALAGDLWREDSLAWLAGNLSFGAVSSVPVVGWVVGPAADVRDAIGSAIRSDWVGSGFSALGAVPGGDAAAIPRKVNDFVSRNPGLAAQTAKIVVTAPKVPEKFKERASQGIWKNWDLLIKSGASAKALLALQEGRTDLDHLADALNGPNHVDGVPTVPLGSSNEGEARLQELLDADVEAAEQHVRALAEGCTNGCTSRLRFFDTLAGGVAHEAKVGHVAWSPSIRDQIKKDAWLIESGMIQGAHWHLFASSASNTVGADTKVYQLLEEEGLSYTIHLPAESQEKSPAES